jgi:hypothetical protein
MIVGATIIAAASYTKNSKNERDPQTHRKRGCWLPLRLSSSTNTASVAPLGDSVVL